MKKEKTERGVVYSDPAMVQAGFSRQTREGVTLFGSSVKNGTVISLAIHATDQTRFLSRDWYHAHPAPIIEVLFTPHQFAELLTTMNVGNGVPGTLVRHNGETFDLPELPSKAEQFRDEIADDTREFVEKIKKERKTIENLLDDPKPIGKQARRSLKELLVSYQKLFDEHLPFIISQFERQMATTVAEAKAEVDAFVEHTVVQTGIEALKSQRPQIEEKT
jgi:hypothetical protein